MTTTCRGYQSSALLFLLATLQLGVIVAAPVEGSQLESQIVVPGTSSGADGNCPVLKMTAESHQLFYEFCHSVEGSNGTRDTAYLSYGYKDASKAFEFFVPALTNQLPISMSTYCLAHLRTFACFNFFPFPHVTKDKCEAALPCRDFCESTTKACESELNWMVANNLVSTEDLTHLSCDKFPEGSTLSGGKSFCISTPPIDEESASSSTTTDGDSATSPESSGDSDPPTVPSSDCKCANVRSHVTQKTFTDKSYTYSMAARVQVLAFEEIDNHVVYEVNVSKEYQISCTPLLKAKTTMVHTQQPMECRDKATGCVFMDIGGDYMIVGHYGIMGEWLLKDLKGNKGTVVSAWNDKYEKKMDSWVSKGRPIDPKDCAEKS